MARALKRFNIPFTDRGLSLLMARCDTTGDGKVIYHEFVDALVQDKHVGADDFW